MSKRKGVSAEEKRTRMLQLFYEKKEFFQLKELEKIAPKEKGIIVQSVKDVVQNLVDDGLVDTDKIGTSVYFWAYPSKAKISREKELRDLEESLAEVRRKLQTTIENLGNSRVGKESTKDRAEIFQRIEELKTVKSELELELQKYVENDPDVIEQLRSDNEKFKEAANRWTDNIFAMKSWCKDKFGVEESALDKQFGIPSEMDYV